MESKWRLVVAALLWGALLLSACSEMSSQETLARLQKGMTVEDVKSALGRPSTDEGFRGNKRMYAYKVSDGYVVVLFIDEKVTSFHRTDKLIYR